MSLSGSTARTVTLSDPTDPLTLTQLIESTTVNGRTSRSAYVANASGKTVTFTSAAARTATMTLDKLGRVSSVSPPGVQQVVFHYDARGRNDTITQGNRVTTFGFDPTSGFVNSVTDPMGHVTSLTTDPIGLATPPRVVCFAAAHFAFYDGEWPRHRARTRPKRLGISFTEYSWQRDALHFHIGPEELMRWQLPQQAYPWYRN